MKRILSPALTSQESYRACAQSIIDEVLQNRILSVSNPIEDGALIYIDYAIRGITYSIPPIIHARGTDPIIIGDVLKSELVKLYDYYMVQRHPGRSAYDQILVAANEKCPFCGGIGRPKSLDHYLPKANYPQFSVLPQNLVPACRDCNTGKSNDLAQNPSQQPLHPYFDADRFFLDQWVFGRVIETLPCSIEFYTCPPADWNDTDSQRVTNHFSGFDLSKRYSIQAAEELGIVVDQRKGFMSNLPPADFSNFLRSVSRAPSLFANHWKRVMYQTLADSEWFCSTMF